MQKNSVFENYCEVIEEMAPCMDDYPYVYDVDEDLYFISEKAVHRFRMHANLLGQVVEAHREFVYPDDYQMLMEDLQEMVDGHKQSHDIQYRWVGRDGQPIWIHCKGRVIQHANGRRFMVGCVNEIGARQQADNISGLYQTTAIAEYLDNLKGAFPKGFFMRLGLDGFKNIVERFGFDYGDKVLHDVADRILLCIAPQQRVYRAISDEFLIMDLDGGTIQDANELYRKIRKKIDEYIEEIGYKAVFTISAGAILTEDMEEQNYGELMRISRFTLSVAKQRGRNQLYCFEKKDFDAFLRKRAITSALREAVANDCKGFELYFQPIMFSPSGKIFAAESLCRFFMDGQMVSPVEFIPILEESGLIIPVGKWIIKQAFSMCKRCREVVPDFQLTINISYVQILKSAVTDEIIRTLREYDLDSSSIIVELTESGYLDSTPSIQKVWEHLRKKGVKIAIDDFGTGYSNLQYISKLMPNVIKIDRGFTIQALNQEYMNHLLDNIIRMAHSMDLKVCIEGIESEEELNSIRKLEPDYIQGYYYGKPCDRETFMKNFMEFV